MLPIGPSLPSWRFSEARRLERMASSSLNSFDALDPAGSRGSRGSLGSSPCNTLQIFSKSNEISSSSSSSSSAPSVPIQSTPSTFEIALKNALNESSISSPSVRFASASIIPSMSFSRRFPSSASNRSLSSFSSTSTHSSSSFIPPPLGHSTSLPRPNSPGIANSRAL